MESDETTMVSIADALSAIARALQWAGEGVDSDTAFKDAESWLRLQLPDGGTPIGAASPSSRWMEVCHSDDLSPLLTAGQTHKFLASSDEDAYRQLDGLAKQLAIPRDRLTVRPHGGYA